MQREAFSDIKRILKTKIDLLQRLQVQQKKVALDTVGVNPLQVCKKISSKYYDVNVFSVT
jgi:hypothetical protein